MRTVNRLKALSFAALFCAIANPGDSQTIVVHLDREPEMHITVPSRRPIFVPPIELRHHKVTVDVSDQVAKFKISQIFFNNSGQQLEGTYISPLPPNATISAFSMTMNGQMVAGEVLDKDKARSIYEGIVRRKKDPGLLEFLGCGVIRARVFPILPRQETRIEFEYIQILESDSGLTTLRYLLRPQERGQATLPTVSIAVDMRSRSPLSNVFSPSHPIAVMKHNANHVTASFEGRISHKREDFVLYSTTTKKDFGLSFVPHRLSGEDGFFLMLLSPQSDEAKRTRIPKDIAFVLDTSGSMAGKKMEQAKQALLYALNNLGPDDRFNVIPFSTEARPFHETPVVADKSQVEAALHQVEMLQAAGGTNIGDALARGLNGLSSEGRVSMVVFLTDGLPTIGETDIKKLLAQTKQGNAASSRIFVFGVGHDVNTFLLDRLAEDSSGTRQYVSENEDIEFKVSAFYAKVANPVLSNVTVQIPGAEVTDVYPKKLPDLFLGSQITVMGRYRGTGPIAIRLSGREGSTIREFVYETTLPDQEVDNGEIRTLWARRKVGYLLDQIRLNGSEQELVAEVIRLGKRFGIVTPYTSYLVVEDESGFDLSINRPRFFDHIPAPAAPSAGATPTLSGSGVRFVGPTAVRESETIARLKSASWTSSNATILGKVNRYDAAHDGLESIRKKVRRIEGKTFFLRSGVWIDTDLLRGETTDPPRKIKAFSPEYFELLRKDERLAHYFSLGDRVRVRHQNATYEVTP